MKQQKHTLLYPGGYPVFIWKLLPVFLCAVMAQSAAKAQPVITGSNFNPVPGDFFVFRSIDYPSSLMSPGSGGAGVTWDFSSLHDIATDPDDSELFLACTATSHCDTFPGANLIQADGGWYNYFIANDDSLSAVGNYNSGTYAMVTPAQTVLRYPAAYGTTYNQTYLTATSSEYDHFSFDGYGTLILATGTYTNVLRMHISSVEIDSDYSSLDTSISDGYRWLIPGVHEILFDMWFDRNYDAYYGTVSYDTSYSYMVFNAFVSGIAKENKKEAPLTIYPNPGNGRFTVTLPAGVQQPAIATITTPLGRKVKEQAVTAQSAGIELAVPAGIYFLTVTAPGYSNTQKIFVNQ